MNLPVLDLFYAPMSDEACVEIAEFLRELAYTFEGMHLSQIMRYRQSMMSDLEGEPGSPRQLSLFD